jgi:hypothetical protein
MVPRDGARLRQRRDRPAGMLHSLVDGSAIMLIHKGNLLKNKSASLLLAGLLVGLGGPFSAAAAAASATAVSRAPDAVATEFYGWYLETLGADQDPLSDRYERFSTYVARPLVDQLLKRLREPGAGRQPPGDYFLQSARIQGAWLRGRVRAVTLRRQARSADVLVTLDGEGDAKLDLELAMVLDNGTWKIRHVNRAALDASESSAGQPII